MRIFFGVFAFFIFSLLFVTATSNVSAQTCITPSDDLTIIQSVTLCPGTYQIADPGNNGVLIIGADNITVDGGGATLSGGDYKGVGIKGTGRTGMTIKNISVEKYFYGIRFDNSQNINITNNTLSNQKRDVSDPTQRVSSSKRGAFLQPRYELSNDSYGAALLFNFVNGGLVDSNVGNNQNLGFSLFDSNNIVITNNNFSNNFWGVRLERSSDNRIESNNVSYNRKYCKGFTVPSCDSAGILAVYGTHRNIYRNNDLRFSGDGFFGSAVDDNVAVRGADDNLFEGNDGSNSYAHGFEVTFARGNIFRNNISNNNYYSGFWLGYSWDTLLTGNTIHGNAGGTDQGGISIDQGSDMTIVTNSFNGNQIAVNTRNDTPSSSFLQHAHYSKNYYITNNTIANNGTGFTKEIYNSTIKDNLMSGNTTDFNLTGTGNTITNNNADVNPALTEPMIFSKNSVEIKMKKSDPGTNVTTLKLWKVGSGDRTFTITSDKSWLTSTPSSGTISTFDSYPVSIHVDTATLVEGDNIAYLTVAGGPTRIVKTTVTIEPSTTPTPTPLPTLAPKVASGSDDVDTGCLFRSDRNEVYIGQDSSCSPAQLYSSGFRFQNVGVAPGANIANAYLEFTVDGPYSAEVTMAIRGEASGNAVAFSASHEPKTLPKTTASVLWNVSENWSSGVVVRGPNIASVIQEIVNRGDWSSGNSMIVTLDTTSFKKSRTDHRRVFAYERDGSKSARLVIEIAP